MKDIFQDESIVNQHGVFNMSSKDRYSIYVQITCANGFNAGRINICIERSAVIAEDIVEAHTKLLDAEFSGILSDAVNALKMYAGKHATAVVMKELIT